MKRHVVHDTIYVRDTVRVQDTIIIADYIHSEEFKQLFFELNGANTQIPPDSFAKIVGSDCNLFGKSHHPV